MARTTVLIVLIHGLFGWGKDESSTNLPDGLRVEYWNGIPEFIEGQTQSQPEIQLRTIVPALPTVDSIEVRGAVLQRKINEALAPCSDGTRVHLIAHSRGGLDARWVIVQPGIADKIASLTTIGTAHRGTTFMSWAYALLPLFHFGGKLLKLVEDLKRRFGMRSSEFYYHFLQGYDCSAEQMRRALYPVTLKGAAEFNAALAEQERLSRTRSHHPVMYRAYGGRVARVRMPFLRLSHAIIAWFGTSEEQRSGNDGASSVWSAHYPWEGDERPGGTNDYVQTVPLDHYEQVNWEICDHNPYDSLPPELQKLYGDILDRILECHVSLKPD